MVDIRDVTEWLGDICSMMTSDDFNLFHLPDSVEMPAPVKTSIFGLSARKSSRNWMYFSGTGLCLGTNWSMCIAPVASLIATRRHLEKRIVRESC